tara:strand:+ start:79124 stop:79255 length:132 start_codon:yes stop_codon:yes gene_type:complete
MRSECEIPYTLEPTTKPINKQQTHANTACSIFTLAIIVPTLII